MREILAIAVAGAAGTVGRWALSEWANRLLGERLAYGTLAVNVVGCLLAGIVAEVMLTTDLIPEGWRAPLMVGFLGAFTTFSTFGYETMRYLEAGDWRPAAVNVGANLGLCLGAVWLGFVVARAFVDP